MMHIIPTFIPNRLNVTPTVFEDYVAMTCVPLTDCPGLVSRYSVRDYPQADDQDTPLCIHRYGPGYSSKQGIHEFSDDNQEVVHAYLKKQLSMKDRIVIVEIGVHRNTYNKTSTSVFLDNKRPQDIYIGIDIDDKSFLNDPSQNIYTIQSPSENTETILKFLKEKGVETIDIFMVDGWHSINQVYKEWEYTALLASKGVVLFHDTNAHPGPYFMLKSIDTSKYNVYKYLSDICDWGIGVAEKKE
jgi:23S rRNA U2552 (ribose-2'-O)-methylase RlmE/FtsJ